MLYGLTRIVRHVWPEPTQRAWLSSVSVFLFRFGSSACLGAQTWHGRVHGEKGWHALRASESAPRVRVPWRMSFSAILLNPKKKYISIDSEFLFFF